MFVPRTPTNAARQALKTSDNCVYLMPKINEKETIFDVESFIEESVKNVSPID